VKESAADATPPGLTTDTFTMPSVDSKPAGTEAVSFMAVTKVVVRTVVPHLTVAPETNFVPLTVIVKPAAPAAAELGLKLVIEGGGALTVNVDAAEVPPEVVTVIFAGPEVAIREAGTAAVNFVALANVVASAVVPHFTVEPETKFVPLTVSVNAGPPAVAELGLRLVMAGGGGRTVRVPATKAKT
jgi:hypothetical protein